MPDNELPIILSFDLGRSGEFAMRAAYHKPLRMEQIQCLMGSINFAMRRAVRLHRNRAKTALLLKS
jgi:hypothetical protein